MITENLSTLKIHKLTKAQYDRELTAGRIDENALYLTPDEESAMIYTQNEEPANAEDGAIWIDMDEDGDGSGSAQIPTDYVSFREQTLSNEQKEQARKNIDAANETQINNHGQAIENLQGELDEFEIFVLESIVNYAGVVWEDISSQYSVTCSNSSIKDIILKVDKIGNTYHLKVSFSSSAKIAKGTKITFTITGGQLPQHNYHDSCYSDETIGIGILSPTGTLTARILSTDWPANYSMNFCYEYTVGQIEGGN